MAPTTACCSALQMWSILFCVFSHAVAGEQQEDSLYMWIDAYQARVLIGFEEDILIVSEGKMAPFTHDFRKAQQRMPAIPVNIQAMNFTWQATGQGRQHIYCYYHALCVLCRSAVCTTTDPQGSSKIGPYGKLKPHGELKCSG